ncbi:MAG: hypothetical protein ABI884_08005 [Gemmatimonadota bacterium]
MTIVKPIGREMLNAYVAAGRAEDDLLLGANRHCCDDGGACAAHQVQDRLDQQPSRDD